MVREICRDEAFLSQRAEPATKDDLGTAQDLLDTLLAHKEGCVGMAANMIGVNKRIIAFDNDGAYLVMLNPVIIRQSEPYEAEEGCLSLTGTRRAKRFRSIKVQWQNRLDGGDHPARDRPLRGDPDMIFWFSGTGNSKYAAQRMAEALNEPLLCMNDRIKAHDTATVETGERLVIVTPTYAWRIPRLVRDWLLQTELRGARQAWFVMTCGSEIGSADRYNRELCRVKGLSCMGTAQIVMPENYIAMFGVPQADEARRIVAKAEPDIDRAIAALREGLPFPPTRNNLYDRLMSGPVNPLFYSCFVKDRAFTAGPACTGCGLCVKRCPTNNISLQNGRPVWGGSCTHCMACICRCPAEAIEYGRKSRGKPRYHFEAL